MGISCFIPLGLLSFHLLWASRDPKATKVLRALRDCLGYLDHLAREALGDLLALMGILDTLVHLALRVKKEILDCPLERHGMVQREILDYLV